MFVLTNTGINQNIDLCSKYRPMFVLTNTGTKPPTSLSDLSLEKPETIFIKKGRN